MLKRKGYEVAGWREEAGGQIGARTMVNDRGGESSDEYEVGQTRQEMNGKWWFLAQPVASSRTCQGQKICRSVWPVWSPFVLSLSEVVSCNEAQERKRGAQRLPRDQSPGCRLVLKTVWAGLVAAPWGRGGVAFHRPPGSEGARKKRQASKPSL
ncbi:uncharacterized protein LY79DRAFT_361008 [Colletotrichum navitas]|uniref:Uncharacterized protein n=1 Tax=Colletotrichum navitas TaxID=681940 RepID=A0AAD8PR57_9PEZI|nr:uncharacterized protein LY79DRAFT_361008 [Colletotrichum navitas]KAK1574772.1 hypothetical protein LY79DRAFT_361008 [Colletotrichum navitas]